MDAKLIIFREDQAVEWSPYVFVAVTVNPDLLSWDGQEKELHGVGITAFATEEEADDFLKRSPLAGYVFGTNL